MVHRRGTAIVDTKLGILLVAGSDKKFMLPGGQARKRETRTQTAMRELREETGLKSKNSLFLFNHEGNFNSHTVVLVKTFGRLRPRNEVKYIEWYNPNEKSNFNIVSSSKEIIRKYLEWKEKNNTFFKKLKITLTPKVKFQKPQWHRCNPPNWVRKKLVNSGDRIKGRHFEYKLYIWIGKPLQQGNTDWRYYRKEIL
jgi:8-oxo-dGTP diphosphatase